MGPGRHEPGANEAWSAVLERLEEQPREDLDGPELDDLADALFWLDRVDDSIDARRQAYVRHSAAGDRGAAAGAAWRLFYDHFLVGETAVAAGWIERCRVHVDDPAGIPAGWLAIADSDLAASDGDDDRALVAARRAVEIGRVGGDPDLVAMALQAEGRARIRIGDRAEGMRRLDEAMVAVTTGELDELYTGWVYCNVVSTCYELADLDRATQWSDAAMRWCETLSEGRMYPGLCRVYAVELSALRGDWDRADADAERACAELTAFDPRYAGEAFYQLGELRRRRGDLDGATELFARANELGRPPHPGWALLVAHRQSAADAVAALRTARSGFAGAPLPHALLLSELCALAAEAGDLEEAADTADELRAVAEPLPAGVIAALATGAEGRVAAARGDCTRGGELLRDAAERLAALRAPYESARLRLAASRAAAATGDRATARLDARSAVAAFERMAAIDRTEATRWLRQLEPAGGGETEDEGSASPLTDREVEVLRLVATGSTNRQIAAALFLSPHTVSRHLSNIFTKLDVNSRAAATAYAYEHEVVPHARGGT